MDSLLETYLKDHYAGSVGGIELAQRMEENNRDSAFEEPMHAIRVEIERDQAVLARILKRHAIDPSGVKNAGAWLAEKFARLKANGHLVEYSPLSRVLEIEALRSGVLAKRGLWEALSRAGLASDDLSWDALCERADSQLQALTELHERAAHLAFASD